MIFSPCALCPIGRECVRIEEGLTLHRRGGGGISANVTSSRLQRGTHSMLGDKGSELSVLSVSTMIEEAKPRYISLQQLIHFVNLVGRRPLGNGCGADAAMVGVGLFVEAVKCRLAGW